MNNLVEWIIESVNKYSNKVFIIDNDIKITYKEFYNDILKVYNVVDRGKVLLKSSNKYNYVLSFTASLFKRSLPFLSNPKSNVYDSYTFDQIIDDEIVNKGLTYEPADYKYQEFDELSPACVILSSGTSATPKPIVLSHKGMAKNIESGFKIYYVDPNWVYVNILPLDHAFGITSDFLDMMFSGTTICYSYSIIEFFLNLKKYNPDSINIPINILQPLIEIINTNGIESLGSNIKQILVGGSKCSKSLVEEFKKYNITICTSYGLTECSPCVSICSPKNFMIESDGKIFDCHNVEIAENGEIIVKGDSIMLNYYDLFEKGIIADEVHTKDIGYIKDGFLFVTGRLDNLLVLDNGFKIQPETFESHIKEIDGVVDCVLYLKHNKLTLDVIKDDKLKDDIRKMHNDLDLTVNYVDKIEKNALGKISRAYYRDK